MRIVRYVCDICDSELDPDLVYPSVYRGGFDTSEDQHFCRSCAKVVSDKLREMKETHQFFLHKKEMAYK